MIVLIFVAPRVVHADPVLSWDAASGLTPDQLDPPYKLILSDGATAPVLEPDALRITTEQFAQNAFYLMTEPLVTTNRPFTVEFRVQLISGVSSVEQRGPIMLFITTSDATGTLLGIDIDQVFFMASSNERGAVAEIDTDEAVHTYRLEHDGTGGFKLFYDDGEILTSSAFIDEGSHGTRMRIGWGEGSILALSDSRWVSFTHNSMDKLFRDSFESLE
jgi:hypothetical protein